MTDRIDARLGHSINRALVAGDVDVLMALLAQYLAANDLRISAASIDELARNGLIETH